MEFILGERERERRGRKRGRNEIFREEVVGTRREGSRERGREGGRPPSIADTGPRNPVAKKRIRRNGPLIKALGPNESSIYLPPTRR